MSLARATVGAFAILVVGLVAVGLHAGPIRFEDEFGHRLVAITDEATNVIPGLELEAGGGRIGRVEQVEAVEGGRKARLTMRIEDRVWPLPQGTRFKVRWGGTVSFSNRHVLVTPGPSGNPPLREGATIPVKDFETPVEVDELLAAYGPAARRDLTSFLNRSGAALDRSREELRLTLIRAPAAVDQGAHVMGDVAADPSALRGSVRRTGAVMAAVRRADPGLRTLLSGAATTFDAIGDKHVALRTTLSRLPAALTQTQETLDRADGTLDRVGSLAERIGPGVRELGRTAGPVNRVLGSVLKIAPDATATLATTRVATPEINAFLKATRSLTPELRRTAEGSITNLRCIRPWTPEIIALMMNWGDFHSYDDYKDKFLQLTPEVAPPVFSNSSTYTPAEAVKAFPDLRYSFPRPPGYLAGQTWFQPECGAGPEALDPSKDLEARKPPSLAPRAGR